MKALDVAKWFLVRNRSNNDIKGDNELISNLKLQKLLYYAQGVFLAIKGVPLFEEDIVNWAHGPVVESVYKHFSTITDCNGNKMKRGAEGIDYRGKVNLSLFEPETKAILDEVFEAFGQFSAWKLREMTHSEDPWKSTKRNDVIPNGMIRDYFVKNIVE